MTSGLKLGIACLFVTVAPAFSGEPSVHFDLTAPRFQTYSAIPFMFQDSNAGCPEDRWTMSISNGVLKIHHLNLPPDLPPLKPATYTMKADPSDDYTYAVRYLTRSCHADIDIRQQVRTDGEWKSMPVIEWRRPSLTEEARREALRRRTGYTGSPQDAKPVTQADVDKLNELIKPKGPPRWTGSTLAHGFSFDGTPSTCMEVFGEYRFTNNSFDMAFFSPLPGELNKFVMDGFDLDDAHARIYLTKNDCRFEFTISQSIVRDGQSLTVPLHSFSD